MDGRGRLGGSVREGAKPAQPGLSGLRRAAPPVLGEKRSRRLFRRSGVVRLVRSIPTGLGSAMACAFLLSVTGFGLFAGGHADALRAAHGEPKDAIARLLGLGIEKVTISGISDLHGAEVLAAAGINEKGSLAFLDVGEARRGLDKHPLIAESSVRKLYPHEVAIRITEREPYALWQLNGEVSLIGADGAVIDRLRDSRFVHLPLVVGEGANLRVREYVALLNALGPLQERVRGATLISKRRWTIKLDNGVDVRLPEIDPEAAAARLARLDEQNRIIERDVLAIDLRQTDRVTLRLSEEAAAARAEKLKSPKKKGGEA
jgi:cell division protein FtsQ